MKLSDLLKSAQYLLDNKGDIEVLVWDDINGGYRDFVLETAMNQVSGEFIEIETINKR